MAGWFAAGMAWAGRWSEDVGTAGSLCHRGANDGKRLNDDYRQMITIMAAHFSARILKCLVRDLKY